MTQLSSSCYQMESKYKIPLVIQWNWWICFNAKCLLCSRDVHYIDRDGSENYYTEENFPSSLEKKMKLLTYFRRYMNEHLVKAGGAIAPRECDSLSRIPYLHTWFRTPSAVVMHLTNGTLQVWIFIDPFIKLNILVWWVSCNVFSLYCRLTSLIIQKS